MKDTNRLGRGISSLIPTSKPAPVSAAQMQDASLGQSHPALQDVSIDKLKVNPRQPRKTFTESALKELADSITEKGVLQPILVRRVGHHYEIIAGERRFRASKIAGLKTMPAHVVTMTDQEQLEAALIENIIREDLSACETARAFEQLQKQFNLTQEDIATRTGKDRSTVANLLRLLALPKSIQKLVDDKKITMGHARALLRFDNPVHQDILATMVVDKGLSVRQVEQWTFASKKKAPKKNGKSSDLPPNLRNTVETIQQKLGAKVQIQEKSADKGEIRIPYYHPLELQKILTQLLK